MGNGVGKGKEQWRAVGPGSSRGSWRAVPTPQLDSSSKKLRLQLLAGPAQGSEALPGSLASPHAGTDGAVSGLQVLG